MVIRLLVMILAIIAVYGGLWLYWHLRDKKEAELKEELRREAEKLKTEDKT
jgi:lipopolysaccharide export system protein LptC